MVATLVLAVTTVGAYQLVEFAPDTGETTRVLERYTSGSRYSQKTILVMRDFKHPEKNETFAYWDFSVGSAANLIYRETTKTWYQLSEPELRDIGSILEMIRVEQVAKRPISFIEKIFRSDSDSEIVRRRHIQWGSGRFSVAISVERPSVTVSETVRTTQNGKLTWILDRVEGREPSMNWTPSSTSSVKGAAVKGWLKPFAEILFPITRSMDFTTANITVCGRVSESMSMEISRRGFMGLMPAAAAFASAPASILVAQQGAPENFPSQKPSRVREMVGVSHGNIERVKELLTESPELAKATWDWGFGDWETAIGAASHVGRKDIVELLVEHGARPDIFTFAMMDDVTTIKAIVAESPKLLSLPGPHGITLRQHAVNGNASKVLEYLKTLPDSDKPATSLSVTDTGIYVGRYEHDLEIILSQEKLAFRRGEGSGLFLNRVEAHGFAPVGAPHVRIRFAVAGGKSTSLSVHEPMPILTAKRV